MILAAMEGGLVECESKSSDYDANVLCDLLPVYYRRLFPFKLFYRWLSYGNIEKTTFCHREFSFTLQDDIYLRYQSFADESQMAKEIKSRNPHKIDIGAVYSSKPRNHQTNSNFHPVEKELVFDIDMTDYDDVRTCCSGADICEKCWWFMVVAIKILERVLTEDFGYCHMLWVYSGRRGIHCWVCDEGARKLSPTARSAVAEYISVVKGGEFKSKKVQLGERIHPSVQKALKIIEKYFDKLILVKQDYFSVEENCKKVISLLSDDKLKALLEENVFCYNSGRERWNQLRSIVENAISKGKTKAVHYIEEVMLQLCYPRLDINVTKGLNHLLKSPFCIHPKTGRVCVPIDVNHVDNFNPFSVPTICQLCEEINLHEKSLPNEEMENSNGELRVKEYKKTSLIHSISVFNDFVSSLEKSWKGKRIQQSDVKKDF